MNSDIRRNNEVLAIFPGWVKQFDNICTQKRIEVCGVDTINSNEQENPNNSHICKVKPQLSPKRESIYSRPIQGRRGVSHSKNTRRSAFNQNSGSKFSLFFQKDSSPVYHKRR